MGPFYNLETNEPFFRRPRQPAKENSGRNWKRTQAGYAYYVTAPTKLVTERIPRMDNQVGSKINKVKTRRYDDIIKI